MRLVAALAAASVAAAPVPAAAQNAGLVLQPGETLLEVQAEGVHRDRPDVMTIRAGVVTTGATAGEALGANSEIANRLIETVRSSNVAPGDVRTTDLRVQPVFQRRDERGNERDEPRIVGYTARNTVELRLRDLARAPELIDALLGAGANSVDGPSFTLADDRPARMGAQRDAIRLARQEADNYAGALGMRVTRVLRVSERGRQMSGGEVVYVTGSRIPTTPIEPGELETKVTVWVDFALAPQ